MPELLCRPARERVSVYGSSVVAVAAEGVYSKLDMTARLIHGRMETFEREIGRIEILRQDADRSLSELHNDLQQLLVLIRSDLGIPVGSIQAPGE